MKIGASSDLARLNSLQRQAITARGKLDLSGTEMTTGERSSRFEAAGGNLTRLFSIDRALERNSINVDTIALSEMRLGVAQEALGKLYGSVETLSVNLLGSVGLGDLSSAKLHAQKSRLAFVEMAATLNTRVAGQSLFAGTATDGPALQDGEAMLADIKALATPPAATDAQAAIDAIDAYFAPGGGFFTTGYLGSDVDVSPVEVGDGVFIDTGLRADRDEMVAVLRAHALAAIVADGAFDGDDASQKTILTAAADEMLVARDGLTLVRTQVGVSEGAMEDARAERTAERSILELTRAKMVSIDPLESASRYQALEAQLEAIYTVTARLSELRFSNFIR